MKTIGIKNYQGIEDMTLKLHPGVNVLIGPSDSAKSSVFRATRDHSHNSMGEGHVMAGAKSSEVVIDEVKWEKGGGKNRYTVGQKKYDKVGRGVVPEEVQDATGIRPVEFGDGVVCRLNFAGQFDPEFMVGFKGSENAKIVGSLSGINVVFNAQREATSDLQKTTRAKKTAAQGVEDLEAKVGELEWVEPLAEQATAVFEELEEMAKEQEKLEHLEDLRTQLEGTLEKASAHKKRVKKLRKFSDVNFAQFSEITDRIEALAGLRNRLATTIGAVKGHQSACEALKSASDMDFKALGDSEADLNRLIALQGKYGAVSKAVESAQKSNNDAQSAINDAKTDYNDTVDDMDMCPVTGLEMAEECKTALKESA